ncbi:hypothetical protein [Neorhizobium sp. P12A]|uniref:hypothetical protein n=1 Tax=Neorhizobium sp. P12A TaxID=2268027 RepID=UPI0011EBF05A|nr:hypothetical protein [Neorhizobium sp. P12A]
MDELRSIIHQCSEEYMTSLPGLDRMSKVRKIVAFTFSCAGLVFAGWLGFHLAGIIAMILFAPLGALGGLLLGCMRLVDILELVGSLIR